MKKHLSVFGFFARSSFFKVFLILLAMCAVEITFFHFELQDALEAYEVVGSGMPALERMFMRAATNVYFRVALVLWNAGKFCTDLSLLPLPSKQSLPRPRSKGNPRTLPSYRCPRHILPSSSI